MEQIGQVTGLCLRHYATKNSQRLNHEGPEVSRRKAKWQTVSLSLRTMDANSGTACFWPLLGGDGVEKLVLSPCAHLRSKNPA